MTIIDNPETVLRLWASAVSPRSASRRHRRMGSNFPASVEAQDDRRLQARAMVETTEGYRKCYPVLWVVYVDLSKARQGEEALLNRFRFDLSERLRLSPIMVESVWVDGGGDPRVTLGEAFARLEESGTPVSWRTLLRWCDTGKVFSYKQGRERIVRWRDVCDLAPKRKKEKKTA
jgi:hypothetical protein